MPVPGNHTARFAPDPSAIGTGVTAMTRAALACFGGQPDRLLCSGAAVL
jgi:hypothetical protein